MTTNESEVKEALEKSFTFHRSGVKKTIESKYKAKTSRDCDYKGVCVVDACFHTKYDNDSYKPISCSKLVKLEERPCGIKVV